MATHDIRMGRIRIDLSKEDIELLQDGGRMTIPLDESIIGNPDVQLRYIDYDET